MRQIYLTKILLEFLGLAQDRGGLRPLPEDDTELLPAGDPSPRGAKRPAPSASEEEELIPDEEVSEIGCSTSPCIFLLRKFLVGPPPQRLLTLSVNSALFMNKKTDLFMLGIRVPISSWPLRLRRRSSVTIPAPADAKEWKKMVKDPSQFASKALQNGVEVSWRRLSPTQQQAMSEAKVK